MVRMNVKSNLGLIAIVGDHSVSCDRRSTARYPLPTDLSMRFSVNQPLHCEAYIEMLDVLTIERDASTAKHAIPAA